MNTPVFSSKYTEYTRYSCPLGCCYLLINLNNHYTIISYLFYVINTILKHDVPPKTKY